MLDSSLFDIKRGVRQGCVLSPRILCTVLEMAMGMWRRMVGRLGDGGPTLLELRFADDILIFATTYSETTKSSLARLFSDSPMETQDSICHLFVISYGSAQFKRTRH